MEILLGPSGSPSQTTFEGISQISRMGLHAMELSFTHGVKMSIETAKAIKKENENFGIKLSIHAPYFINLCSEEEEKRENSKKRILDTCERAHYMGAQKVVFHPAYYGKMEKDYVFNEVKKSIIEMQSVIRKNRWNVELAPETSGKIKQFGSIDEIMSLVEKTGCSFCIDVAHIYARNLGKIEYGDLFYFLEKYDSLHFHFEGIEVNSGGEGRHLEISGNKPDFFDFARELIKREIDSVIISESPVTWRDSLRMKEILRKLGYDFDKKQPY